MQAMILAAGFGTRLLPYTKILPKPLFPVLGRPLLLATIERLQHAGFSKIIVNCHHLGDQIVAKIVDIPGVIVQVEETILGTGGGLRRALAQMEDEPLLITNGDIYHSIDYLRVYQHHRNHDRPVTMTMHDYPRFNTVQVAGDTVVGFAGKGEPSARAFTGVHVIDPSILQQVEDGVQSCIIELYRKLLQAGRQIDCLPVDGCFWTDMGTVPDYLALHGMLLHGEVPVWPELNKGWNRTESAFCLDKAADVAGSASFDDWVCVGAARICGDTHLRRVVVWDGAEVTAGTTCEDEIVV